MAYRAHSDGALIPADKQRGKVCYKCRRLFVVHALQDMLHRWLFCPFCGARRPNLGYPGRRRLRELGWRTGKIRTGAR